jgi:hypothetical protein
MVGLAVYHSAKERLLNFIYEESMYNLITLHQRLLQSYYAILKREIVIKVKYSSSIATGT